VVTKLITHGADVDLENKDGNNSIDYVLSANPFQPHVAQLMLDCSKKGINRLDADHTNYIWAANTLEAIKFLVKNGIDVNNVWTELESTCLDVAYPEEEDYLRSVGAKLYSEL
jgi:ankyrin repeat protein